jgi:hypothetical protein
MELDAAHVRRIAVADGQEPRLPGRVRKG